MDKNTCEKENFNPFKQYLEEREETPHSFAKRSGVNTRTIYDAFSGKKGIRRSTAARICRHTSKKLSLKDFGFNV